MLNKFMTPASEGIYRAFLNAAATFGFVTLTTYKGIEALGLERLDRWETALVAGGIACLAPFVTGSLIAGSDQKRADEGKVKPADVPEASDEVKVVPVA